MATEVPLQSSGQSGTRLRASAIGLGGATMQAVATIAPAIAGLFFTQYVVSLTGVTAPLAYVLGVLIVLMLGSTLVQLSKHMSSAGGYYTFVSRAINSRVGFLTAWMYVFYNPVRRAHLRVLRLPAGAGAQDALRDQRALPVVADPGCVGAVRGLLGLARPGGVVPGPGRPRPGGDGHRVRAGPVRVHLPRTRRGQRQQLDPQPQPVGGGLRPGRRVLAAGADRLG